MYLFVKNSSIVFTDTIGLKSDKTKIMEDDFGRKCCKNRMKIIIKYTLKPFTKKHIVGHSFIYCPSVGYRGKYPEGNLPYSTQEIKDDSTLYYEYAKQENRSRLIISGKYRACPESYEKMANLIKHETDYPDKYILAGAQCENWVDYLIKATKTSDKKRQEPKQEQKDSILQMPGTPKQNVRNLDKVERRSLSIFLWGTNF